MGERVVNSNETPCIEKGESDGPIRVYLDSGG
jgi:hypothetical protein